MNFVRMIGVTFLLLLAISNSARISDAVASVADPVNNADKEFLASLKQAVANNDVKWIAARINYPIRVFLKGRRHPMRNKKQFIAHYSEIFNDPVKRALAQQGPDDLFKNWAGLMVGNGQIWFEALYATQDTNGPYDYYIIGINNCGPDMVKDCPPEY